MLSPTDEQIERLAILMASARIYKQPTDAIARIARKWDKPDRQWFAELVVKAEDMIIDARSRLIENYIGGRKAAG